VDRATVQLCDLLITNHTTSCQTLLCPGGSWSFTQDARTQAGVWVRVLQFVHVPPAPAWGDTWRVKRQLRPVELERPTFIHISLATMKMSGYF